MAHEFLEPYISFPIRLESMRWEKPSAQLLKMPFLSVDVECVATGRGHNDLGVCRVAVVDENERVLLNELVKPDKSVVSYLTPITGLRAGDLDNGKSLDAVLAQVHALLSPDVTLVGQAVANDIKWLQLDQGVHYKDVVDLSEVFATYNPRFQNTSYFSLQHEADTLLGGVAMIGTGPHDPANDALACIRLHKKYCIKSPHLLASAKQQLLRNRPPPNFRKQHNYRYEGVCMAAFFPAKCTCGQPTKKTI